MNLMKSGQGRAGREAGLAGRAGQGREAGLAGQGRAGMAGSASPPSLSLALPKPSAVNKQWNLMENSLISSLPGLYQPLRGVNVSILPVKFLIHLRLLTVLLMRCVWLVVRGQV